MRPHLGCGNISPAQGFPQSHQACACAHTLIGLHTNIHSGPHLVNAFLMRSYCVLLCYRTFINRSPPNRIRSRRMTVGLGERFLNFVTVVADGVRVFKTWRQCRTKGMAACVAECTTFLEHCPLCGV